MRVPFVSEGARVDSGIDPVVANVAKHFLVASFKSISRVVEVATAALEATAAAALEATAAALDTPTAAALKGEKSLYDLSLIHVFTRHY